MRTGKEPESKTSVNPEGVGNATLERAKLAACDLGILVDVSGQTVRKLGWSLKGAKLAIAAYYPELHFHCLKAGINLDSVKRIPKLLENNTAWFILESSQHLSLLKMTFDNQILAAQVFDSTGAVPKSFQAAGDSQYSTQLFDLIKEVGDTVGAKQYRVECVKGKRQVDLTNCFSFVLSDLQTALTLSTHDTPLYTGTSTLIEIDSRTRMQVEIHEYFHKDFYKLAQSKKFLPPDIPAPWTGQINDEADKVGEAAIRFLVEKGIIIIPKTLETTTIHIISSIRHFAPSQEADFAPRQEADNIKPTTIHIASSIGHFAPSQEVKAHSKKELQENLRSASSMHDSLKQRELKRFLGEIDTGALMQAFVSDGLNIESLEITSKEVKIPLNQIKEVNLLKERLETINTTTGRKFTLIIEGENTVIDLRTYRPRPVLR